MKLPSRRTIDSLLTALIRLKYPDYKPKDRYGPKGPEQEVLDKDLAGQFDITPASFSHYKFAQRKVDKQQARIMAEAWVAQLTKHVKPHELRERLTQQGFNPEIAKSETALIHEFEVNLREALLPTAYSSLLHDVIDTKGGRLQISSLNYGIFAGEETSFFERFTERYFNQLGAIPQYSMRTSATETSLKTGETHLAMCYFASVSRILNERFFQTPLRISLGAVSHNRYSGRTGDIAKSLYLGEWSRDSSPIQIRPIVVRGEVGHLHCVHTLRFSADDERMVILEQFDSKALAAALANEIKRIGPGDEDTPIPVVIVDEYTALEILRNMRGAGLFAVPISGAINNFESQHRRELPQYFMSLACSRAEEDFWDFLLESLSLFLNTEVNTTSRLLAELFWKLEEELLQATEYLGAWSDDIYDNRPLADYERQLIAREYALYTLSLDHATVDHSSSYPEYWREIIRRARKLVMKEMVKVNSKHEADARSFTHSVLSLGLVPGEPPLEPGEQPQLIKKNQLDLLMRYTDQTFDINECRGYHEHEVFAMIRAKLEGVDQLEAEIYVQSIDPASIDWKSPSDFEANGIKELLNRLGDMYSRLPGPLDLNDREHIGNKVRQRISRDLRQRFEQYAKILLAVATTQAVAGPSTKQPVGIVCILGQPGCRDGSAGTDYDHLSQSCELRYLWVADRYRKRNISQLLLYRALQWCREQSSPKYKFVRVAILPQLETAIEHVRQIGFETITPLEYDRHRAPGRLIYEFKL